MQIKIDTAFENQIPSLSKDEFLLLKESIITDGLHSPLIVWKEESLLLDGHHRYKICKDNNVPYKTEEISLPDRTAAEDWIDRNQIGRRNLKPDQISLIRGRRYERAKKAEHDGGKGKPRSGGQNDHHLPWDTTAKALAKEHGVSEKTIRRDGKFAQAVEEKKKEDPDIEKKIMAGEVKKKDIIKSETRQRGLLSHATPIIGADRMNDRHRRPQNIHMNQKTQDHIDDYLSKAFLTLENAIISCRRNGWTTGKKTILNRLEILINITNVGG